MSLKVFKIWDTERKVKKSFLCEVDLDKIITKARGYGINGDVIVLECDGTQIDDNDTLDYFSTQILQLIGRNEFWIDPTASSSFAKPANTSTSTISSSPIRAYDAADVIYDTNDLLCNEIIFDATPFNNVNNVEQFSTHNNISIDETKDLAGIVVESPSRLSTAEIMNLFINYDPTLETLPSGVKQVLENKAPIANLLQDFVHYIINEMRTISTYLPTPVCRLVAKKITARYPLSFGILDENMRCIDVEAVTLTTALTNHNSYVSSRIKTKSVFNGIKPKFYKKIKNLHDGVPGFSGENTCDITSDKIEQYRLYLKESSGVLNQAYEEGEKCEDIFKKCFNAQRAYLNNFHNPPTVSEIQMEWPTLLKRKYLEIHFDLMMKSKTNVFCANFRKCFVKLDEYVARSKKFKNVQRNSNAEINALQQITSFFSEDIKGILVHFEEGTNLTDVRITACQPTIAAFQFDIETKVYYIYVETIKMGDSYQNLTEALHMLLATYFVLNMEYAANANMSLMLLQQFCDISAGFGRMCNKTMPHKAKVLNLYKRIK